MPWEISIKRALGKLEFGNEDYVQVLLGVGGGQELPVSIAHAKAVEHLPPYHSDPFDRLLIVQAQLEGATIVTGDPRFRRYDVSVLW